MKRRHRPASFRDTLSVEPSLRDKLAPLPRFSDHSKPLIQKEFSSGAGWSHTCFSCTNNLPFHDTERRSMDWLNEKRKFDDKTNMTSPILSFGTTCSSHLDADRDSNKSTSTAFTQSGSSHMRLFDPKKKLINPPVLGAATWGARILLTLLTCLLATSISLADGNRHKLSKDVDALRGGHNGTTVDVIIQFNQTPAAAHHQKVQDKGGVLKNKLDVIKGAHYSVPVASLPALADDPDVTYISPNRPLSGTSASTLDFTRETVNAQVAWQQWGLDGTGVGVAVIDSGVTAVGDLYWWIPSNQTYGSRVAYSQSFVPGTTDTSDQYGHGTHVAGIIAGAGWFSTGSNFTHTFKGIAPNANIINLRVLDQNGAGTDSSVIAAIQTAISLKSTYNIRVINLSLGRQVYESYTLDPLCQAVEAAWNAGIVVVVAAGNQGRNHSAGTEGYGTIPVPGNDPYAITVGAMKTDRTPPPRDSTIATYSSKGPTAYDHVVKPDLVAPGNFMVSSLQKNAALYGSYPGNQVYLASYTGNPNPNLSPVFYKLSGTSMAAPIV